MTNEQEKIIKFLNSLERDHNNRVSVSRKNYILTEIEESDFIKQLNYLEKCNLISVHFLTGHRSDLKYYIDIDLYPSLIDYFMVKKKTRSKNIKHLLWEFTKFTIPTIISIIALLKSFGVF